MNRVEVSDEEKDVNPDCTDESQKMKSLSSCRKSFESIGLTDKPPTPPNSTNILRRILVPLDGSENSKKSFKWCIRQFMRPGDQLIFLQVIVPPQLHTFNGFAFYMRKEEMDNLSGRLKSQAEAAKKLLRKFKARALHHNATGVKAYVHIHHSPGEALIEAIKEYDIDEIVVGRRGVGPVQRRFLGSVSDYVLHHADIPVIIVPPIAYESEKSKRNSAS